MIKNTLGLGMFISFLLMFSSVSLGSQNEYGMDCEKPTISAQVDTPSTFSFNCKNTTSVTFGSYKVFPIFVPGATITATACSGTIAPGAECLVQGTFIPDTTGVYEVDFDDEYGGEKHYNIFCNNPEKGCIEAQVHYIGEYLPSEGGVVFYIDSNGGDTLIIALNDAGSLAWANMFNNVTTSTDLNTGFQNTQNMANLTINPGGSPAASACIDYPDTNHPDWYVPSRDELIALWSNKAPVNTTLGGISGATEILNDEYWSSSQLGSTHQYAWIIDLSSGGQIFGSKDVMALVRCVRAV